MMVATDDKEKPMASDAIAAGQGDEPRNENRDRRPEATAPAAGGGFFHIYKRGQGYWTRMGSAAAAALIAALTVQFLYARLNVWFVPAFSPANATSEQIAQAITSARIATLSVCAAFLVGMGILVFYLLNKPDYADFLIATDSEMKKVNWTSRKELMGSTKIVIIFMFIICILLFGFDVLFGDIFYQFGVLKTAPFEGSPHIVWTFRIIFIAAAAVIAYLSLRGDRTSRT
jgi:preprotein translocase subunit SecE